MRIDAVTAGLIVESVGNPPAAPFFPFSAKACHFSTSVFPEIVCNLILTHARGLMSGIKIPTSLTGGFIFVSKRCQPSLFSIAGGAQ
jgi:hypothetical protein